MRSLLSPLLATLVLITGFTPAAFGKGKKVRHPQIGFRINLPDHWKSEPAEMGMTLLPPGVVVNPQREDNPEVYSAWAIEWDHITEEEYIKSLRERFKRSNTKLEREGDVEAFSTPGRPGVIYTFDFIHPDHKSPYRIRVYAMQHKGRPLLLVATGQRDKLAARDAVLREIARSVEW